MRNANDNVPADELRLANRLAVIGARAQENNAAFAKLSAADKRVAIARDVLKWLQAGKLTAKRGVYLETKANDLPSESNCTVCALGALFSCWLDSSNGTLAAFVSVGQEDNGTVRYWGNQLRRTLEAYFSYHQLWLIECAFECQPYNDDGNARIFGQRYQSDKTRLRAIMRNIIANRGTFVP